jgi:hypothetical protein
VLWDMDDRYGADHCFQRALAIELHAKCGTSTP